MLLDNILKYCSSECVNWLTTLQEQNWRFSTADTTSAWANFFQFSFLKCISPRSMLNFRLFLIFLNFRLFLICITLCKFPYLPLTSFCVTSLLSEGSWPFHHLEEEVYISVMPFLLSWTGIFVLTSPISSEWWQFLISRLCNILVSMSYKMFLNSVKLQCNNTDWSLNCDCDHKPLIRSM
jgi:hypothetical protein